MERFHKNIGGYHGETIKIGAVLRDIAVAAEAAGWCEEPFYDGGDFHLTAWHRPAPALADGQRTRRFYISAGIHGDEPAPPLAILRLLRENRWPADAEVVLLPCLNPAGFRANRRENAAGLDLNRDYLNSESPEIGAHIDWLKAQARYDLCLCLHEDWEAAGFYLYELNPQGRPTLAEAMVAAVAEVCPVDLSPVIEGREAHGGIIRPALDPRMRPKWPESFWLIQNKTTLSYTLEAPSDYPLRTRVAALTAAVQVALANCR